MKEEKIEVLCTVVKKEDGEIGLEYNGNFGKKEAVSTVKALKLASEALNSLIRSG